MRDQRGTLNKLSSYVSGVIFLAATFIILSPYWMPTPIDILVGFGLLSSLAAFIFFSFRQKAGRIAVMIFALIGIFVTTIISGQLPFLKYMSYRAFLGRDVKDVIFTFKNTFYDSIEVVANASMIALETHEVPLRSNIPTMHLRVMPGSLQAMASNLPDSAKKTYYPAYLRFPDNRWRRIKYRFRGRNLWHWHPEKPSLRLKLPKKNPIGLQRHINLINPEDRAMVSNVLGDDIAKSMGVLTLNPEFVRLFINNRFFGVYHQTLREDEGMLLANRRVPGPIYIGDHLNPRWRHDDFETVSKLQGSARTAPLEIMIDALYQKSGPEQFDNLWEVLSFDKLARWDATMKVVGGNHTDFKHNNLFYFDPRLGQIEPVTTDINGHGMLNYPVSYERRKVPYIPRFDFPLDERITPVTNIALRDPRFRHARNKYIAEAINGVGSIGRQNEILDSYYANIDADVRADIHKGALESVKASGFRLPFSNGQYEEAKFNIREWIKKRNKFLTSELETQSVSAKVAPADSKGDVLFTYEVSGHTAIRFDPTALKASLKADIELTGDGFSEVSSPLLLYPGLQENKDRSYPRMAVRFPKFNFRPGRQYYLFSVSGISQKQVMKRLAGSLKSDLTGRSIAPDVISVGSIDPSRIEYDKNSIHPWLLPSIKKDIVTIGPGNVDIRETLIITAGQTLRVLAGTNVRMGAGVSIISKGKVLIEGTQQQPVLIRPADEEMPWGGILIQGSKSAGSAIRHAHISGGTTAGYSHVQNSGMISVYGSDRFSLEDSTIMKNTGHDDTLHVVYGNAEIQRSSFRDCFSDCIDVDFVNLKAMEIDIYNPGNDGIDFMDSSAKLNGISIDGAYDKALSIGERSSVEADNVEIFRSQTGIAVKDASFLRLEGSKLKENEIAMDIYNKKWRYHTPGSSEVRSTDFDDNRLSLRIAEGGKLSLGRGVRLGDIVGGGQVVREK